MVEVAAAFALPVATLGYGVWSAEFLSLRKEEEFLKLRAAAHPEWDEQAKQ